MGKRTISTSVMRDPWEERKKKTGGDEESKKNRNSKKESAVEKGEGPTLGGRKKGNSADKDRKGSSSIKKAGVVERRGNLSEGGGNKTTTYKCKAEKRNIASGRGKLLSGEEKSMGRKILSAERNMGGNPGGKKAQVMESSTVERKSKKQP